MRGNESTWETAKEQPVALVWSVQKRCPPKHPGQGSLPRSNCTALAARLQNYDSLTWSHFTSRLAGKQPGNRQVAGHCYNHWIRSPTESTTTSGFQREVGRSSSRASPVSTRTDVMPKVAAIRMSVVSLSPTRIN